MISVFGAGAGGCHCAPLYFVGVSVWGCFVGCFVVWLVFRSSFGVGVLLFSY